MFYEQLSKLCKQNKTSPTAVTELLGLSKGTITSWKKGSTPNGDTIVKFAEYFNVSTDFLLTGNDEKNKLHKDEQEILQMYSILSDEDKKICLRIVKGLNSLK